ncbi:MAG: hypothetical protein GXZ14_10340 [Ruminococcaceae bacterium]|nr:hypothetical protein [Oscillospiraceae bacterium]
MGGFSCPIECLNDAELAHYAVVGGDGILLISGTGAITYGTHNGKSARVGGWMISIMGEEGSGTWVSRHALRHLAKRIDGVVPETKLSHLLERQLCISTAKQLMELSAKIACEPTLCNNLGGIVDSAANSGDIYAVKLLQAAAEQSVTLVTDLADVLGFTRQDHIKIGVWGSNIVKSKVHYTHFLQLIKQCIPNAEICFPTKSALDGACELALDRA